MMLITGATGNVGREAIDLLLAAGETVRAVTRNPGNMVAEERLEVVQGDPSRPATLRGAFEGIDAVLLSPRATGGAATELLSMAAAEGVKHVVVLSALTVQHPAGHERFIAEFRAVEAAARESGLFWTMLRAADFDANALAWAPQIRENGTVRGAYASAATSSIHEHDVAAVALRAVQERLVNDVLVLTGPKSLTQSEKVAALSAACGKDFVFEELPPEAIRAAMLARGIPEEIPDRLLGSLSDYAREPGPTTDTVEEVLGRPALSFSDWALEHAAAFS